MIDPTRRFVLFRVIMLSFSRIHEIIKWILDALQPSLRHEAARERRQIQPPPVPRVGLEITLSWDAAVRLIHLYLFIGQPRHGQ